jgi:hypothetical protein
MAPIGEKNEDASWELSQNSKLLAEVILSQLTLLGEACSFYWESLMSGNFCCWKRKIVANSFVVYTLELTLNEYCSILGNQWLG